MEESKIVFICLNSSSVYEKGKLLLPLPFYVDHGRELPEKVNMHVPSGAVWVGRYVKGSLYLEGLEEMMVFYGIKPYYLTLLHYDGLGDFRVNFYTPYAVEMKYAVERASYPHDLVFNPVEVDMLCSTFRYNACRNFVGVFDLLIEKEHLMVKPYVAVLGDFGCSQLRLTNCVKWLTLAFEKNKWRIKLKWVNGEALLGRQWLDFVKTANVVEGDLLSFQKTEIPSYFKVSIVDVGSLTNETVSEEYAEFTPAGKFFKMVNEQSMETGELELPLLFKRKYGGSLNHILEIELGGGYSTKFSYCRATKKIYNLRRFMRKYEIKAQYVIFFDYVGYSKFSVSVYDSQCMNHFRDINGFIRLEDYLYPPIEADVVDLSDGDNSDMDVDEDNEDVAVEDYVLDEFLSFTVVLQRSNVDQTSHGVYIPCNLWSICRTWGKRTTVTLLVGARQWNVQVLRNRRIFRFGIGWDAFTGENGLATGNRISFQYIGNLNFRVTI